MLHRPALRAAAAAAVFAALPAPAPAQPVEPRTLIAQLEPTLRAKSFRAGGAAVVRGQRRSIAIEFAAPDRMHVLFHGNATTEAVMLPTATYLRGPGGAWTKYPVTANEPAGNARITRELLRAATVVAAGVQRLGGVPTRVYDVTTPKSRFLPAVHRRLWVGLDGYLRRASVPDSKDDIPIDYRDYNAPVIIKAPA